MSFRNWRESDKELSIATEPATQKQQRIARQLDVEFSPDTPKIVAASMLRVALAEPLSLALFVDRDDRYQVRMDRLVRPADPPIEPQTDEERLAWIAYLRLVRRRESLSQLELTEGDVVETSEGELAEVSSISGEGRVFFKGGRGFGSWPDLISVVARADDNSSPARDARRQAANLASRRNGPLAWSVSRHQELLEFAVGDSLIEDDVEELERIVATAEDEGPIQRFLQENRYLLTALLIGNERYCIPQKRLGSEYVPDFVIGDVNSLGVRWVLVELETPRSGIYLNNGKSVDESTRKGIGQIIDWRNWLGSNIDYARRRRSEEGLALFDIREKTEALVLVGRRSMMPETKDAYRNEYRMQNNIHIHTYDWLIATLRAVVQYQGPPACNPYLIWRSPTQSIGEMP